MKRYLIIFLLAIWSQVLLHNMAYAKEVKLETIVHIIDNHVVKTRADNFISFFTPKYGKSFSNSYDETSTKDFAKLRDLCKKIPVEEGDYFYVLHIRYGLEVTGSTSKIKLFYLPDVAVKRSGETTYSFQKINESNPTYYTLPGVVPVAYSDAKKYFDSYRQDSMIMLHPFGMHADSVRALRFGNDSSYDAQGMVFPFQEYDDLFDLSGNTPVYVINIAETDEIHGNNFYKHGIVFSSEKPGENPGNAISANLGGLCPPRCDAANVKTIRRGGIIWYLFDPMLWGTGLARVVHWLITAMFAGYFVKRFSAAISAWLKRRKTR